jgi:hypothetical protein
MSIANASIILARNSSSPSSSSMYYCQCEINCCLHVWAISTIRVQNFFKIQWDNLRATTLTKIWWAFCMCMFSCILCTSLHEKPPSLFMCASSHKKDDNNIRFDFDGHNDMVISRVQTHSCTNQNTRPNIWVYKLLIFQWWRNWII